MRRWYGLEIEFYLFDLISSVPNSSNNYIDDIVENFDERVYRDYYPHQLEIRTYPSKSLDDIEKQMHKLFANVLKEALRENFVLIPKSHLSMFDRYMYCGMHIHITDDERTVSELYSYIVSKSYIHLLSLYPFISTSKIIRGSKIQNYGLRLSNSPHISLNEYPPSTDVYFNADSQEVRYKDIAINTNRRHGRHRLKDVDTVEIRLFDTIILGIKEVLEYIERTFNKDKVMPVLNMIAKEAGIVGEDFHEHYANVIYDFREKIPYNGWNSLLYSLKAKDIVKEVHDITSIKNKIYQFYDKSRIIDMISQLRIKNNVKSSLIKLAIERIPDDFIIY